MTILLEAVEEVAAKGVTKWTQKPCEPFLPKDVTVILAARDSAASIRCVHNVLFIPWLDLKDHFMSFEVKLTGPLASERRQRGFT